MSPVFIINFYNNICTSYINYNLYVLCTWQELQDILITTKGDVHLESKHLIDIAFSLLTLNVPKYWLELIGPSAPPSNWPLKEWIQDLVLRFAFLDRVLIGGLAKTPTYWLGAFFNPQAFLSVIQQVGSLLPR